MNAENIQALPGHLAEDQDLNKSIKKELDLLNPKKLEFYCTKDHWAVINLKQLYSQLKNETYSQKHSIAVHSLYVKLRKDDQLGKLCKDSEKDLRVTRACMKLIENFNSSVSGNIYSHEWSNNSNSGILVFNGIESKNNTTILHRRSNK